MLHHIGRPNVLLIITDQQRADTIENPLVKTPNLNVLANQGVICPAAYVQSPQCQPSRASIFTGRYPTAHRVWWNEVKIPRSELTIGNYLRDAGYQTGYYGKLHFDGDTNHCEIVKHFGFNHSFLFEDWARQVGQTFPIAEKEFYDPMMSRTWTGRFTHKEMHHEEIVTNAAISFIKNAGGPFFCVVSYHGPHPPYAAPDEFSGLYDPKEMAVPTQRAREHSLTDDEWRALKVQYYGSVSWIDSCVGRLLAIAPPDTIVVFTSDHGDILGDHGLFSKGLYAYEGNTRVPLIFKIPMVKQSRYNHLVQSIDIVPTILTACGIPTPAAVQGKSLLSFFDGDMPANDCVLSMIGYNPRLRMVRTTNYKYWICGDNEFLFDLDADPDENVNLGRNHPAREELLFKLVRGLIRAEDPLPQPA